jgi:hypothetical protein
MWHFRSRCSIDVGEDGDELVAQYFRVRIAHSLSRNMKDVDAQRGEESFAKLQADQLL